MSAPDTAEIVQRAFSLQRQGALAAAEALYRDALALHPNHPDCLHMLGVLYLRQKKYIQGVDYIEQACIAGGWRHQSSFQNLVRGLAHLVATFPEPTNALAPKQTVMADRAKQAAARLNDGTPLVSILIPSYNHAQFIRGALRSVLSQTYAQLEIIVIDDGSTDSSPEIIRDELSRCSIQNQFISRDNRGAYATINECIALASGRYINALNSDDVFAPNRIEEMIQAVHQSGAEWGFSRCALIDKDGKPITDADHRAAKIRMHFSSIQDTEHTSHHFVLGNPAVSTGNIFISKELVQKIGGFSNYRYNHDWAFCLDAIWHSEPVMVRDELYQYRLHSGNTISEAGNEAAKEADTIVSQYCQKAETQIPINALALCKATYPARLCLAKLMHMRGEPKSSENIRHLVQQIREQYLVSSRISVGEFRTS
jgi:hypothetical protein